MVNDLPIEFSNKKVTPFGGMVLMKRFMDKLKVRDILSRVELPMPQSNRGYDPREVVEAFWLSVWTGASRYIHCDWLRSDKVLQKIFGFQKMPSQSTYSRFFGKFSQSTNNRIFPYLQKSFFDQIRIKKLTVDVDSTVITRYGKQEGSAKGYNPNKRGRNSHHPLMAFISETRMVANAWLRPGNTGATSSCEGFMEETFNKVLEAHQVGLVRADSGFYSDSILDFLEKKRLPYIVAVKFYDNLKRSIGGVEDWVEIFPGLAVSEMKFSHPTHQSKKTRRYIIVRKEKEKLPESHGRMLFDCPSYRYSCFVTSLELPVEQIYRVYNSRADCENRIKELKKSFGLENFCLKNFWATEASYRFIMAAYNLMALFRHSALNSNNQATLQTLRSYCFALGAWTSSHSNKTVLKISLPPKKRPWMLSIFSKIQSSDPPFYFPIA